MQGDRRQGAFVVPQTGLHISVGLVDLHGLGCSCQIHSTLSQDHLKEWQKAGGELKTTVVGLDRRLKPSLTDRVILLHTQACQWSGRLGRRTQLEGERTDLLYLRAKRDKRWRPPSQPALKRYCLWCDSYIMLRYVSVSCNFVTISLTHILTGKADQPARHIKRVLTPLQHTAQPVESGILIRASHRLMQGWDTVVMLLTCDDTQTCQQMQRSKDSVHRVKFHRPLSQVTIMKCSDHIKSYWREALRPLVKLRGGVITLRNREQ